MQFQMVPQCMHKGCPKPQSKHTPQEMTRCKQAGLIPFHERTTPNLYCSWCSQKAARDAGLSSVDELQTVTKTEWQMMFQLDISCHVPGFRARNGKEHVERLGRYAPESTKMRDLFECYSTGLRTRFMGTQQLIELERKLEAQGLWLITSSTPEVWQEIFPDDERTLADLDVPDESVVTIGAAMPARTVPIILACQLKPDTKILVQHMGKTVKATVVKNPLSLSREDEASLIGINLLSNHQQANSHPYGIHDDSITFVDRATLYDNDPPPPPARGAPSTSTAMVVAPALAPPSAFKVAWPLADGKVEHWPAVKHEKSIYEFVKVKLDPIGEIQCDAGMELWKHEHYLKGFDFAEPLLLQEPSSSSEQASKSSTALGKRKVPTHEQAILRALNEAKRLVEILESVQEVSAGSLSDQQRQPVLKQCQRIMDIMSEPGIKKESEEDE